MRHELGQQNVLGDLRAADAIARACLERFANVLTPRRLNNLIDARFRAGKCLRSFEDRKRSSEKDSDFSNLDGCRRRIFGGV